MSPAIEVQGLSKVYRTGVALRDVSFAIEPGERVALLGRNGAGKTTALRSIAGLCEPSAGTVRLLGAPVSGDAGWRRQVGFLPDEPPLHDDMRVDELLTYAARLRGLAAAEASAACARVLERCGLGDDRARRIGTLSHGQRQRVGLAQALVHEPAVLLLDEPAAGLDPAQSAGLRELLADLDDEVTLLLSSHLLGEVARICERFLVLERGAVIRDVRAADVLARVRLEVEPNADAPVPARVLEEALGDAFESAGEFAFRIDPAQRSLACRALLDAGHELLALERDPSDALEALFTEPPA